ncbi:MAG: MFS transporter, partial [Bacilli bacterium]
TKKLLVFSLSITAAVGFYYATIPPKEQLIFIFLIWGISTVFTFWSALIKAVTLLAQKGEEGFFFGALDGGRGVVEALLATLAVFIFAQFVGTSDLLADKTKGLQAVILLYSISLVVLTILLIIFIPNGNNKGSSSDKEVVVFSLDLVLKVIKTKEVWLVIGVIFGGYTLFWTVYYYSGYLQTNHGATDTFAAIATVGLLWTRPLGGFIGGFIADKLGRQKVLGFFMLLASIGIALLATIVNGMSVNIAVALIIVVGFFLYGIRGVYWSVLDDCNIPAAALGVGIGLISLIGYLPDIILPKVSSAIFTNFGDNVAGANNLYLLISAGIGLIGAIISFYFYSVVKKKEKLNTI